ncbi:MAG: FAD-binding oxidoreductase [Bryobacteraceae bacterium]|nr:FAD-binding oxidoreductase [Bryobacteraceae bacterium]
MNQTAEVVIVGGGIVGSSVAYHLAEAGVRDVLVLEREPHQGMGSTGKSMGGVRAQFSSELNIRLSMYSIAFFRCFDEVVGHPSGYRPQGYLFLATRPAHMDYLARTFELQTSLGLRTVRRIATAEIAEMVPQVRTDDVLGGSFCSTDGFVDPHSVMTGFMARARDRGVRLMRETRVTGLGLDARGIAAVQTTAGPIATRAAVNCAGAWSAAVAACAGVDLPVKPLRRMLVPTEPTGLIARSAPMVIDMTNGFHFRPEGLGLLLAWNDPDETPGFKTSFDSAFVEKILDRAVERVPGMADVEVNPARGWAGLYEMTPDHYPVLGPVNEVPGFFIATGFSGHGVMHSPATGKILADLIVRGETDVVDARLLNVSRFREGKLLEEMAVL